MIVTVKASIPNRIDTAKVRHALSTANRTATAVTGPCPPTKASSAIIASAASHVRRSTTRSNRNRKNSPNAMSGGIDTSPNQLAMTPLISMDTSTVFAKSPVKRIKRPRFLRNVCVALGNTGTAGDLPALERAAADPDPLVAEHAAWAIGEIRRRCGL